MAALDKLALTCKEPIVVDKATNFDQQKFV